MVYVQWGSFVFDREEDFRGKEGINLLVHACHFISFCFSFIVSNFSFPLSFSLIFLVFVSMLWFSPRGYYYPSIPLSLCMARALFIVSAMTGFTILAFNYLCLIWVSLPTTTGLSAAQPSPLTCASCATRQRRLFCLFVCYSTLICYGVGAFSLFLSLMACT